jgi:hypothetical protein
MERLPGALDFGTDDRIFHRARSGQTTGWVSAMGGERTFRHRPGAHRMRLNTIKSYAALTETNACLLLQIQGAW